MAMLDAPRGPVQGASCAVSADRSSAGIAALQAAIDAPIPSWCSCCAMPVCHRDARGAPRHRRRPVRRDRPAEGPPGPGSRPRRSRSRSSPAAGGRQRHDRRGRRGHSTASTRTSRDVQEEVNTPRPTSPCQGQLHGPREPARRDRRPARALQNEEIRRAKALIDRKAHLAQRIRAAYAAGNTSILEILLTSASFNDTLHEVSYYLDVGTQDSSLAAEIAQDVRDVAALHQAVIGVRADTASSRASSPSRRRSSTASSQSSRRPRRRSSLQQGEAAPRHRGSRVPEARRQQEGARGGDQDGHRGQRGARQAHRQLKAARRQADHPLGLQRHAEWPMAGNVTQDFGCTGVVVRAAAGQSAPLPPGHRHRRPVRHPGPRERPGTVLYVGWNYADGYDPAWIVIIAHSSASRPGTPTCSRCTRCTPAVVVRRAGRRLRGQHRPLDGSAPALGGPVQRRVREPEAVPVAARGPPAVAAPTQTKR